MIDFHVNDKLAQYRTEARAWVSENFQQEWADTERDSGTYHTQVLHQKLADDGILGAGWPREYGGSDVDPALARTIMDELMARGALQEAWITTDMILRTVLAAGTDEQKREWIPAGLGGRMLIVLGYTEPGSGSDAAAASLRSVRDGDDWVLNGSKMFTSNAHVATHVFLLTRSNIQVRKHLGLTMFLVPLDAQGVEIQPVHTLGGQLTTATFYRDVRVPDSARVGDVDGGWGVMKVALVHERGVMGLPTGDTLARRTAAWASRTQGRDGTPISNDPVVRQSVARIAVEEEVTRLLSMNMVVAHENQSMTGIEGAMRKLYAPERLQEHLGEVMDIVGESAVLQLGPTDYAGRPAEHFPGEIEEEFRKAVVDTLYGGSTEIMREIVAERYLGLPRNRP